MALTMLAMGSLSATSLVTAAEAPAAASSATSPASPASTPSYFLRRPLTGSQIPRKVAVATSPFDRIYDDLSPEQRADVQRDYPSLSSADEPPFPLHGLSALATPISEAALKAGLDGDLAASGEVDAQGDVQAVAVSVSPGASVTAMAQLALMQEKFRPARCQGTPCAMTYVLRLRLLTP